MTARIKRSLPSTMSSAPILSNFTCKHYKKIESTESPLNSKRVLKYNCENKIKQLIRVKEITPKLKSLDFKTIITSPCEYHKKCMENSVENLHTDTSEWSVKL